MKKCKCEENYVEIAELYKQGLSIDKLKDKYNVSNKVIKRALDTIGVKTRDNSHKGRKYHINENYFDDIDTQNKAYILGLLYADGNNYTRQNNVKLELQERDKDILIKINKELEYDKELVFTELNAKNENWQNTYKIMITNKHISETLNNLGMVPNKSLILTFPNWLDKDLVPHFIRGYLDGDGCIYWNETGSKFITIASTKEFCSELKNILKNYGIKSVVSDTSKKDSNTKILRICGIDNIRSFLSLIYSDAKLYIKRKFNIYKKVCNIK